MSVSFSSKLGAIVGGTTAKKLEKDLGYSRVGELVGHYPRTYVNRGQTSDESDFKPGELVTVVATVISSEPHRYVDRRSGRPAYRLEVLAQVGDSRLVMTFFDRREHTAKWRAAKFGAGTSVMAAGKVQWNGYKKAWELVNPHHNERDLATMSALLPIYPTRGTVSSWLIDDSMALVLSALDDVPELLTDKQRATHGLLDLRQALTWVHGPDDWQQVGAARKRLKFDEALVTQVVLARRRQALSAETVASRPGGQTHLLGSFDDRLPFTLTAGQVAVSEQILADLGQPHPMHRLLQGEVGSGKTVVALRAMLRVVDSGGQAALLAPTEVLALQHHRSISSMLGDLAGAGMLGGADDATQVVLLTGSMSAKERKATLLDIASGAAGIVIGTHALLEDVVTFADLGLVVVDEQHRFGVEQRAALSAKAGGGVTHVLVMTATPIPRTVAMTVFGDLETSTLRELPSGRSQIETTVVPLADRPGWSDRVWERAEEEVSKGGQVYVVCPRIDEGAASDDAGENPDAAVAEGEERRPLATVTEVAPMLADRLPGLRVDALHGRMTPDAKDTVMRAFAAGEVDVLVATTVIEVGVDVPNATLMVVLDADRFGISQLHQLRGRIGRGSAAGLCLLVTHAERESPARTRLDAVAATTDGFALAGLDLQQRREGDVLGAAQSGRSSLRLLSVLRDEEVIVEARRIATSLVQDDPELTAMPALAAAVGDLESSARAEFLEKA